MNSLSIIIVKNLYIGYMHRIKMNKDRMQEIFVADTNLACTVLPNRKWRATHKNARKITSWQKVSSEALTLCLVGLT